MSVESVRNIIYRDLPCWYELSFDPTRPAILLRLHNDYISNALVMSDRTPIVDHLAQKLKLGHFSGDYNGDLGFNGALRNQRKVGDFTEYVVDPQQPFAASASLTALGVLLDKCNEDTSSQMPQLLTVKTETRYGMFGGSLSAKISNPFRMWLSSYSGRNTMPEALRSMMLAYGQMVGLHSPDKFYFETRLGENGGLILNCPGNACGILPAYNSMSEGRGYELTCHNVDNYVQQLTLIAGLAVLHDIARKEIS